MQKASRVYVSYICPLMSTIRWALALACSANAPALLVTSLTDSSFSWSASSDVLSKIKRTLCSSDSKPSSSVIKRIFTSGLCLLGLAETGKRCKESLRFTNDSQRRKPLAVDKHVHQVSSHIRSVKVKLKETMIIPQRNGGANIQGVFNSRVLLVCCC